MTEEYQVRAGTRAMRAAQAGTKAPAGLRSNSRYERRAAQLAAHGAVCGRTDEPGVFSEHSVVEAGRQRLPRGSATFQLSGIDVEIQRAGSHIQLDEFTVLDQRDRSGTRCLVRQVTAGTALLDTV